MLDPITAELSGAVGTRIQRAARIHGANDIRVDQVGVPSAPGPGQILVRPRAVGICGTDRHWFRAGGLGPVDIRQPFVMGHEAAGEVIEIGPGVDSLQAGDRVALEPALACLACESCLEGNPNVCPQGRFCGNPGVDGMLQDYLLHPARFAFRLPDTISFAEGAQLEPLGVALHSLNLGHVRLADSVSVLGCGPIGLMIIQLVRLAGASRVFATDPLVHRREAAQRAGAEVVLDPWAEPVERQVMALTSGRGVDVAFEVAGEQETPRQAVEMLKPTGTLVVVSIAEDDLIQLQANASRKRGITVRVARRMKHVYPRTITLVGRGMVDVSWMITHRFGLEDTPRAFRMLDTYEDGILKAMVEC